MAMRFKIGILKRNLIVLFLCSLIFFLLPFILTTAIFFYLIRRVLTLYKNASKYGDFLNGLSTFFATDSPYENNPSAIISIHFYLNGKIGIEEVHELLQRKFGKIHPDNPSDSSHPFFPELKQFPSTWFGFSIMEKESNFDVWDHLRFLKDVDSFYEKMHVDEQQVAEIMYKLSRLKFKRDKSPWEILVHQNPNEENSIVFIRLHHVLGDGLSLVKFGSHLCDIENADESYCEKFSKSLIREQRTKIGELAHWISYPFLGIWEMTTLYVNAWYDDENENLWHDDDNSKENGNTNESEITYLYKTLDKVPIEKIKKVRKIHGNVKFFTVVMTALTASLRKYMKRKGTPIKIPQVLDVAMAIPMPTKGTNMSNNNTGSVFKIPIGTSDRFEILRKIEKNLVENRRSRAPLTIYWLFEFLGLLPKILRPKTLASSTMVVSNVPGYDQKLVFCGKNVMRIHGLTGSPTSNVGIYAIMVGYGGDLSINLGVSSKFIKIKEELQEISKYFAEELDALEVPRNRLKLKWA